MLTYSKSADTRALIRYDRDVSALGLHRLYLLPAEVVTDLLWDVCRDLRVGGAELVMIAIKKLDAIVGAVPTMEKFSTYASRLSFGSDRITKQNRGYSAVWGCQNVVEAFGNLQNRSRP
eukprot:994359_1